MSDPVLIVGAGPTGLVAAAELLRRGVPVRVVDRVERADPHSKAIILWPRALDVFARLGVEHRIRELALPVTAANYHSGGRRVARVVFGALSDSRWSGPLSLPQARTEEVLRSVLHDLGGRVEYGHEFTALREDGDRVLATVQPLHRPDLATSRRVPWLLGADGGHSLVRQALGVPFRGAPYEYRFALVDGVWETPLVHGESSYFMVPDGVLVVVGLPGGLYRVFGSLPPGDDGSDPEASVRHIASERCTVPLRLERPDGCGVFRVQRRLADTFLAGHSLLMGDAAHVHSPAGGQGLNTSIQDAHEAAWRLAAVLRGQLPPGVLGEWARERRHVAAAVVADTDRQTRLWTTTGGRRVVRDLVLRGAGRAGLLDRVLPPRLAQLDVVYPVSAPTLRRPRRHSPPVPGSRLPDRVTAGGHRLHDVLRAGRHVVLVAPPVTVDGVSPDLDGLRTTLDRYDVDVQVLEGATAVALRLPPGGVLVVRPDGVVALVASREDPQLAHLLEAALPSATASPSRRA